MTDFLPEHRDIFFHLPLRSATSQRRVCLGVRRLKSFLIDVSFLSPAIEVLSVSIGDTRTRVICHRLSTSRGNERSLILTELLTLSHFVFLKQTLPEIGGLEVRAEEVSC